MYLDISCFAVELLQSQKHNASSSSHFVCWRISFSTLYFDFNDYRKKRAEEKSMKRVIALLHHAGYFIVQRNSISDPAKQQVEALVNDIRTIQYDIWHFLQCQDSCKRVLWATDVQLCRHVCRLEVAQQRLWVPMHRLWLRHHLSGFRGQTFD